MKTHFGKIAKITALSAVVLLGVASKNALADSFSITYLAAGVQTPVGTTTHYETFDEPSFSGTTNFNGSSITGTYSGPYVIFPAGQFGGAGGTGNYIATPDPGSYTLTLSQNVNYFGLWFSALDQGNELSFYNGSTLVFTFSPTNFATLVGACPSSSNPFCGNPNPPFLGEDSGQQFAYLNFLDTTEASIRSSSTRTLRTDGSNPTTRRLRTLRQSQVRRSLRRLSLRAYCCSALGFWAWQE